MSWFSCYNLFYNSKLNLNEGLFSQHLNQMSSLHLTTIQTINPLKYWYARNRFIVFRVLCIPLKRLSQTTKETNWRTISEHIKLCLNNLDNLGALHSSAQLFSANSEVKHLSFHEDASISYLHWPWIFWTTLMFLLSTFREYSFSCSGINSTFHKYASNSEIKI